MARQSIAIVSFEWDVVDLIESIDGWSVAGFFDASPSSTLHGLRYLGPDAAWAEIRQQIPGLRVALAIDFPDARARLFEHYGADAIVTVRSPHAHVSRRASVGHGSIVQRGVTIMPNATLGCGCKVNVNGTIHHDACIGEFCTIAPGAQILGNVRVGDGTYIGAGAIVRQRCSVGAGAFVGAGAVVVDDVPDGATVVGVPAIRRLR